MNFIVETLFRSDYFSFKRGTLLNTEDRKFAEVHIGFTVFKRFWCSELPFKRGSIVKLYSKNFMNFNTEWLLFLQSMLQNSLTSSL